MFLILGIVFVVGVWSLAIVAPIGEGAFDA